MRTLTPADLLAFGEQLFRTFGTSEKDARVVANNLVTASLLGHDSHGILRLGRYIDKIDRKELNPVAIPTVAHHRPGAAVVDGNMGFGAVVAELGAKVAIELASSQGVGAVTLSRTTHLGRLGHYAETIAESGHIALIFASGAGPGGSVAPFGGRQRIFGTNPLAWALPMPAGRPPLIADFATSAIPEGKVGMAQSRNETLPSGVLVDRLGHPSNIPSDYYDGGALLPFGGPKGSSLLLLIEVMANLLAGAVPASSPDHRAGNPAVMIALDVEAFTRREAYLHYTAELLEHIENSAPAAGFDRVRLPHAVELGTRQIRERDGIPVPDTIWAQFGALANRAGIQAPNEFVR